MRCEDPTADRSAEPTKTAVAMSVQSGGTVPVIRFAGEFDSCTRPAATVMADAVAARSGELIVDLTGVDILGSASLSALIAITRGADAATVRLSLVADRGAVLLPLQLTGLDRFMSVYPSGDEAVASCTRRHITCRRAIRRSSSRRPSEPDGQREAASVPGGLSQVGTGTWH